MLHPSRSFDRRTFLADLGRGTFALAIFTTVGCSPTALASLVPSEPPNGTPGPEPSRTGPGSTNAGSSASPPAGGSSPPASGATWERVNLGFVSAYLLVRDGEAALVDTGVGGSSGAIESSLTGLGLDWSAVGHVVLTHKHGDHAGSIGEIGGRAPEAAVYAGAEDIGEISFSRSITAVGDGDTVFDLEIVTSPGHTAGSISALDPLAGVLVVGDAMGTDGGKPQLPGAQFSDDMAQAKQSIVKLGGLTFETLLVGHGAPIESGASALVAALGAAG